MDWRDPTWIVATCGRGCAGALAQELAALGFAPQAVSPTAVGVEGNLEDAMRLNLWLRSANRVLFEVAGFAVDHPDQLYDEMRALPWELWLRADTPFHVHGTARHYTLRDSRFALLRAKDAIADRFVAQTGARPDSTASPVGAASVALHWDGPAAQVFLDTSGTPLSHRGYRLKPWTAPLRETLAAALLLELGWPRTPAEAFIGPMCGSGTLAIEAAWIAQRRAPGLARTDFAFLRLNGADPAAWERLRDAARAQLVETPRAWIAASDSAAGAVACARDNAARAGVEQWIRFHTCDFRKTPLPKPPGLVLLNPEYGERLGEEDRLMELYAGIGDWFKTGCQGLRAAVFTGNLPLGRRIRLKPVRRVPMWNGDIECRLLEFDLYEGTRDSRLQRKHAADTSASGTPPAPPANRSQ